MLTLFPVAEIEQSDNEFESLGFSRNFIGNYEQRRFAGWLKPIQDFADRAWLDNDNIDAMSICYDILTFVIASGNADSDGPTRKTVLNFVETAIHEADENIPLSKIPEMAQEALRALDNRKDENSVNGIAFINRIYDKESKKKITEQFRLLDCQQDSNGNIRYSATHEAFAILSPTMKITSKTCADMAQEFLKTIVNDKEKRPEAEAMAQTINHAILEEINLVKKKIKSACDDINAERYRNEIKPFIEEKLKTIPLFIEKIAGIENMINAGVNDDGILREIMKDNHKLLSELSIYVFESHPKIRESLERLFRLRSSKFFDTKELLSELMLSPFNKINPEINATLYTSLPAYVPILGNFDDLLRILSEDENETGEIEEEDDGIIDIFEEFESEWAKDEIDKTKITINEAINSNVNSLSEILDREREKGTEEKILVLIVYLITGQYGQEVKDSQIKLYAKGEFETETLYGTDVYFERGK